MGIAERAIYSKIPFSMSSNAFIDGLIWNLRQKALFSTILSCVPKSGMRFSAISFCRGEWFQEQIYAYPCIIQVCRASCETKVLASWHGLSGQKLFVTTTPGICWLCGNDYARLRHISTFSYTNMSNMDAAAKMSSQSSRADEVASVRNSDFITCLGMIELEMEFHYISTFSL